MQEGGCIEGRHAVWGRESEGLGAVAGKIKPSNIGNLCICLQLYLEILSK